MICYKDHYVFIFICSIFARFFELSDVWDSGKSGQATRLAVFRGSAARLSWKATENPECIHRALNPGGMCLWSLAACPATLWWWLEVPPHSRHRFSNALYLWKLVSQGKVVFHALICLPVYLSHCPLNAEAVHQREFNSLQVLWYKEAALMR